MANIFDGTKDIRPDSITQQAPAAYQTPGTKPLVPTQLNIPPLLFDHVIDEFRKQDQTHGSDSMVLNDLKAFAHKLLSERFIQETDMRYDRNLAVKLDNGLTLLVLPAKEAVDEDIQAKQGVVPIS